MPNQTRIFNLTYLSFSSGGPPSGSPRYEVTHSHTEYSQNRYIHIHSQIWTEERTRPTIINQGGIHIEPPSFPVQTQRSSTQRRQSVWIAPILVVYKYTTEH